MSPHIHSTKNFVLEEIRSETTPTYVKFSRKKKVLLRPIWERAIYIVYKFLESKVVGVDDITSEKITRLHAILDNFKCDWAKHIFESLGMFGFKGFKKGSKDLHANVGNGFMIAYLLGLKGVTLSEGSEINVQAFLFRTLIKGTKKKLTKKATTTKSSENSNIPLSQVVDKEKRKRTKKSKAQVSEEGNNDDEPIIKKTKTIDVIQLDA